MRRGLAAVVYAAALVASCATPEDPRAAGLRERLTRSSELSREEIATIFEVVAPKIAGKTLTIRKGTVTTAVDDTQRLEILSVLSDPSACYDMGLKSVDARTLRGVRVSATPAMAEIDTTKTIWIDIQTLMPVRYDFEYSVPGFGDYSYELVFH